MSKLLTFSGKYSLALQRRIEKKLHIKLNFIRQSNHINNLINNDIDFIIAPHSQDINYKDIDYFSFEDSLILFKGNHSYLNKCKQLLIPPVAFIGAGPGKKEWLTLEAHQLLQLADICFYDALITDEILNHIPKNTELYYVGKRGDSPSFNQQQINQLISHHARMNKKVIRLKGGDCGVLGRLTEEIDELNKYSLPYTITPGITAMQSLPSEVGLFPTQRQISDGFTVTTARQAGGGFTRISNRMNSTLIIYMGILKLEELVKQLLNDGYSEKLPIVIAINLTRSNKNFISGTLKNIIAKANKEDIRPPGLIICGEICHKNLLISPPPFIHLAKRYLIYSDKNETLLQQQLLFWGAYNSYTLATLPNDLSSYDQIIAIKDLTPELLQKINQSTCYLTNKKEITQISQDFFLQAIS